MQIRSERVTNSETRVTHPEEIIDRELSIWRIYEHM